MFGYYRPLILPTLEVKANLLPVLLAFLLQKGISWLNAMQPIVLHSKQAACSHPGATAVRQA